MHSFHDLSFQRNRCRLLQWITLFVRCQIHLLTQVSGYQLYKDLTDKTAFTRTRNARNAGQHTQRKRDVQLVEVVARHTFQPQPSLWFSICSFLRTGLLIVAICIIFIEIFPGNRSFYLSKPFRYTAI